MELLKGKNVLLTGATGGIGSKTAKLLLSSGANIFITGRNAEKLEQLANELGIEPSNFCVADISKTEDIEQLKQQFFMVYSTIDVLVMLQVLELLNQWIRYLKKILQKLCSLI
jgi:short-subunit dehydrogenase